jgi:exonuclease III
LAKIGIRQKVGMIKLNPMIGAVWNIRGLNKTGRVTCVTDLIKQQKLDFVGIQETKKDNIDDTMLNAICKNMDWNIAPAEGSAGGILVGFKNSSIEVQRWQNFKFCVSAIVKNSGDNFTWRLIVVYGSPYEEHKNEFMFELDMVMGTWQGPTLLGGGDFNLVRNQREKSNNIVNYAHTMAFNDLINRWGLIDYKDPNRTFTWSNHQKQPIMARLNRFLASVDWDLKYPLSRLVILPKSVSDHNPVQITFGLKTQGKEPLFRFEKWWLDMEEFPNVVQKAYDIDCPESDPVSVWQCKVRNVRRKVKGWSKNREAELRKCNQDLVVELDGLDLKAEHQILTEEEYEQRKELCFKLDRIWKMEETKAWQRSRERYKGGR